MTAGPASAQPITAVNHRRAAAISASRPAGGGLDRHAQKVIGDGLRQHHLLVVAAHEDARIPGQHDERYVAVSRVPSATPRCSCRRGRSRAAPRRRPALPTTSNRLRYRAERADDLGTCSGQAVAIVECLERLVLDHQDLAAVQLRQTVRCRHRCTSMHSLPHANGRPCKIVPAQADVQHVHPARRSRSEASGLEPRLLAGVSVILFSA